MDSVTTNTKNFVNLDGHCITQVIAIAEKGKFRIYVAWEWEPMASKGVFGFIKSRELYANVTEANIIDTRDYGIDIGGTGQEIEIFPNLFKGIKR